MMYMPAMQQVPGRFAYPQAMQRPRFMPQGQMMPRGAMPAPMPGVVQQGAGARMPRGAGRQNVRGKGQNQQFRGQPGRVPMQQQMPAQAMVPAPQAALIQPGQEPLTASALASATNAEQKQMLGERLFPLIQGTHNDLAGKITGMLLEMDNSELLHLLEDSNALTAKVHEAVKVLEDHSRAQQMAQS